MTSENWKGEDKRRKQSRYVGGVQPQSHHDETAGKNTAGRGAEHNGVNHRKSGKDYEKNNKNNIARPKWKYPKVRTDPIPTPVCPYCKELIRDLTSAVSDKNGEAAHFECVRKHIAASETMEKDDVISYIGGGRFGIITFDNPNAPHSFKIKKIIEWEDKDNPMPWRDSLADRFSLT
ncbi:MAG: hypothetical protein LBC27_02265 [Spirochaetaceae bacterium]|jgi:hypothetical protein|nr:hypothetical protein [Spirochaetaceae bacterium]